MSSGTTSAITVAYGSHWRLARAVSPALRLCSIGIWWQHVKRPIRRSKAYRRHGRPRASARVEVALLQGAPARCRRLTKAIARFNAMADAVS
jgi:hypothetical protein